MERIKDSSYSETETINGIEYKATVLKVGDFSLIDASMEMERGSKQSLAHERNKRLLTKSIQYKLNGEFQAIGLGYFGNMIQAEYTALLRLFNRVNSITPTEINSEEADFLFDVMQHFGTLDFSILDGLTQPRKEFLRSQIAKRKKQNGTND